MTSLPFMFDLLLVLGCISFDFVSLKMKRFFLLKKHVK